LKEEALALTIFRAGFGRGFGPVVRQTTEWMNEWMNELFFAPISLLAIGLLSLLEKPENWNDLLRFVNKSFISWYGDFS
jgi:hypothetical protein